MTSLMNNPGCPCCSKCPCACYSFDNHLNNSSGFQPGPFSKNSAAGVQSFVAGKINQGVRIGHHGVPGRNGLIAADDDCFSLAGGFSVWFWLYSDPTCDTDGDGTYTAFPDDVGVTSYILSKGSALAATTSPPEWMISFPVNKRCDGSSNSQAIYGMGHGAGTQFGLVDDPNYESNYQSPPTGIGPAPASWEFFFMYYDPTVGGPGNGTMYFSIDAGAWFSTALVSPPLPNGGPIHVLEYVGQQAVYFIMDELGFCKDIPAPIAGGANTATQMATRAASLYNGGAGKACNAWN